MNSNKNCVSAAMLQEHLYSIAAQDMADVLQLDASAVSRIKSGERGLKIDEIAKLLRSASAQYPNGLAVVDKNGMYVSRDELAACRSLAKKYLDAVGGEVL